MALMLVEIFIRINIRLKNIVENHKYLNQFHIPLNPKFLAQRTY